LARSEAALQSAQQRLVKAEAALIAAQQQLGEAEADTATLEKFLSKTGITRDLIAVRDRVERVAAAAEEGGLMMAAVAASNVQLRTAEVRAKLGVVGAYAPPRGVADNAPKVEFNLIFPGGRSQQIVATPMHPDDPAYNAVPTMLSIDSTRDAASRAAEEQDDDAEFDKEV